MQSILLSGHYDGEHILLDEPFTMEPNTKLLIAVLPEVDTERLAWLRMSAGRLETAYGDDEPEYAISSVREMNPLYE